MSSGPGLTIRVASTISVRVVNAPVVEVLQVLGRTAGIEIQLAPEVKYQQQPISVTFHDANVADAFNTVIDLAKLRYIVVDQKTVRVSLRKP